MLCQGPIISVPFSPCHKSVSLLLILICNNPSPIRNTPKLVHCPLLCSPLLALEESCYSHSATPSHTSKMNMCCLVGLKWQTWVIFFFFSRILRPGFEIRLLPNYGLQFRKLKFQLSYSTGLHNISLDIMSSLATSVFCFFSFVVIKRLNFVFCLFFIMSCSL